MEQQRKRSTEHSVVQSEVSLPVALYEEMLKKVEEIFTASLKMESSDDLSTVLSGTAMVKAKVEEIIEKLKMDAAMRESERVYEEGKEVEHEA